MKQQKESEMRYMYLPDPLLSENWYPNIVIIIDADNVDLHLAIFASVNK